MITMLFAANYFVWTPVLRADNPPPAFVTVAVGKGTSFLCSVSGSSILIDAGSKPYHQKTIDRQMRRYGINRLDAAVRFTSPDSLVSAIDASNHMLSNDKYLKLSSFIIARLDKNLLKLWTSDGSSLLLAANFNALMRLDSEHPDRIVVNVKRFGIEEYRRLESWLDRVRPRECVVLSSSRLKDEDKGLLEHLAGKREEMTVDDIHNL